MYSNGWENLAHLDREGHNLPGEKCPPRQETLYNRRAAQNLGEDTGWTHIALSSRGWGRHLPNFEGLEHHSACGNSGEKKEKRQKKMDTRARSGLGNWGDEMSGSIKVHLNVELEVVGPAHSPAHAALDAVNRFGAKGRDGGPRKNTHA